MWLSQKVPVLKHSVHLKVDYACNKKQKVNLHGGGFARSIVSKKRRDLAFIKINGQTVNCNFVASPVDFTQTFHGNSKRQVLWLFFKTWWR